MTAYLQYLTAIANTLGMEVGPGRATISIETSKELHANHHATIYGGLINELADTVI